MPSGGNKHMCALKKQEWKIFADQLGLLFDPGGIFKGPKVEGSYRDHNIVLDIYVVSTGQSSVPYTRLTVGISNPRGVFLRLYREGFLSRIGKKLGSQDIKTKDNEFDDMYMIKGNNEFEVLLILDSKIRAKVLSLQEPERFNVTIKGESATFEEAGVIKDTERLRSTLDMLIDFAEKLESEGL